MVYYRITRLSCLSIFRVFFAAGVCFGGGFGILIGLLEQSALGIIGGMFLGFFFGLCSAVTATFYAFIFNTLAPNLGGFEVAAEKIEKTPQTRVEATTMPVQPQTELQQNSREQPEHWEQTLLFAPSEQLEQARQAGSTASAEPTGPEHSHSGQ